MENGDPPLESVHHLKSLFNPTVNILDQLHHSVQPLQAIYTPPYVGHYKGYTASEAM